MKKLLFVVALLALPLVAHADPVSLLDPRRLSMGLSVVDDLKQVGQGGIQSEWNVGLPLAWQITAQPVAYPLSISARPGFNLATKKPEIRIGVTILLKKAG